MEPKGSKQGEQEFFGRGIENQETFVRMSSPKQGTQPLAYEQVEEVPFEEEVMTEQQMSAELIMDQEEEQSPVKLQNQNQDILSNSNGEEFNVNATATKVFSPTIQQLQNQTTTTNKFSNFGFFAGSPRATAVAGVQGNIDQAEDDEMIEESIEDFNSNLMTPQKKQNFKINKPSPSKMRKNPRQSINNAQSLLPRPTESPEMQKRTEQKLMKVKKISHKEADEAEKLRVSNVNLQVEEEEKFVELQLDNQSNISGEKSGNESNLQIYPPETDQLSPVR